MAAQQEIRNLFLEAVNFLSSYYQGSSLTDIFVLVDEESGELSIFDDENNSIVKRAIKEWENPEQEINYVKELKAVVQQMDEEDLFKSLEIYTPFSINFADEDFIVIEELLLIEDDSIVRLEDEFLKRMDKEFDEFLDNLLKE